MSPEQEAELFTTLGRLEQKMDGFNAILETHTAHDSANFEKMTVDLEILKLGKARAEGIAEEAAKHASTNGRNWGAVSGGIVSILVAAVSAYFSK